ncbi:MAG: DUF1501 domain-containing protein [Acidobacteria bacterium]|nr:DUF1501 domain-containing protein [Acidobacteriota bacterium]
MKNRFGFDWSGITGQPFLRAPHWSRRVFFRHLASGIGGYYLAPSRPLETVARAAVSPIATAKSCILIMMAGGPSHIDTFDLKEGPWTPAGFQPASFGDIRWPAGLMPRLAEQMESIALVRSVRAWAAVHDLARNWLMIGRNPAPAAARIAPHIGSVVAVELGRKESPLPAFLSLNTNNGPGSGFLPPENAPFYVNPGGGGLPNAGHRDGAAAYERRLGLLRSLEPESPEGLNITASAAEVRAFRERATALMSSTAVNTVFTWDAAERNRYGNTAFGNACIAARNLVRGNLGTRFVQITVGGWDNHANIYGGPFNAANPNSLGRQFDTALGALLADLKSGGHAEETLVVALGEFGRTIGPVNAQAGRDHFLQQAVLVSGARVRGGRAIGSSDELGRNVADPGWSRSREIRGEDLAATIYSALGIDWTTIRRDDPAGRGFEYVPSAAQDLYGPIQELWS